MPRINRSFGLARIYSDAELDQKHKIPYFECTMFYCFPSISGDICMFSSHISTNICIFLYPRVRSKQNSDLFLSNYSNSGVILGTIFRRRPCVYTNFASHAYIMICASLALRRTKYRKIIFSDADFHAQSA